MTTTLNPYTSPEGDLLNAGDQQYGELRFFSPSCRIGRVRYIAHAVLLMLAFGALMGIFAAIGLARVGDGGSMGTLSIVALSLLYIAYVVCLWILLIQRCHDLDKSGWFSLLTLVPVVNLFIGLYFVFAPGTRGENTFGKRPPPHSAVHVGLALFLPALAVIGAIVAVVSVPAYKDFDEGASGGVITQPQ